MAKIVFTRLERAHGIVRKYGEFSFVAQPKGGVRVTGVMGMAYGMSGDEELRIMEEELALSASEARLSDGPSSLGIIGGAAVHPKLGPVAAIKGQGLKIKMNEKGSSVESEVVLMTTGDVEAFKKALLDAIGFRDELRAMLRGRHG